MKIRKRNGTEEDFNLQKIITAVTKANNSVSEDLRLNQDKLDKVIATAQKRLNGLTIIKVEDVQDIVEEALMKHNCYDVARSYIVYRDNKKKNKKFNTIEEQAMSLIAGTNEELRGDNTNKRTDVNSSMRDYLAGLVCKSVAKKTLPKEIYNAHNEGWIHYHDMDYSPVMPLHNCDLLNIEDMLLNGFQMGDVHIDTPKTFSNACNLLAQINLIVSGSQYGGQTISWSHLLPIVERSRQFFSKLIDDELKSIHLGWIPKRVKNKLVEKRVRQDIHVGIKTYQYQVLCHQSSNGQTPFVSNNLCLREAQTEQELKDLAFIIEEILKRRIKGVKDESGKYIPPLFPKLLYWECEGLNVEKSDPYYYLTELAVDCIVERMQPDIKSEKKCREVKHGQIIPSMGCRSWLSDIWEEVEYPLNTEFYYQHITDNKKYKDAPGPNFDYSRESIFGKISCLDKHNIVINFRGNSGWVKEITDDKIIVIKPIVYGRWNEGVISLNLPMCALTAAKTCREYNEAAGTANEMNVQAPMMDIKEEFFRVLDEKLELCHKALLTRHDSISKIIARNSPILWQHGALYRADRDTKVIDIINAHPSRPSISLGFAGLCETCWTVINKSNTTSEGQEFCKEILKYMNKKCDEWKEQDHLNYSLYGTPEENLTSKFSMVLQKNFGVIEHITDKDYVVNSYHVDPREPIDAFNKLKIEGQYLSLCKGGAVSYIEVPPMKSNKKALLAVLRFMYDNIYYAEINTKLDTCYECGFQGEIELTKTTSGKFEFKCPCCGNTKDSKMNVTRRICGYLGTVNAGNTNTGRLDDIYNRVLHL